MRVVFWSEHIVLGYNLNSRLNKAIIVLLQHIMTVKDLLKRENNNLDLIRIILATAVIFGHTFYLNGNDSRFWIDPVRYFVKFTYSGALAVKIFFFISGMVVTNSFIQNRKPIPFITARLFRILPGLFFVITCTAFIFCPFITTLPLKDYFANVGVYKYVVANYLLILRISIPGVFQHNFYPGNVNGSLWSLKYELGCYLTLLVLFFAKKKLVYNIIGVAILFDALVYPHFFKHFLDHSNDSHLLPFCFTIGYLLAINADRIKVSSAVAVIFFFLLILFRKTANAEAFLILFCCSVTLLVCRDKNFLKLRPKYDISYGIYLWGFFIQQIVFTIFGSIHGAIHFGVALVLSACIAFISFRLIEQPFIKIGKRVATMLDTKFEKVI